MSVDFELICHKHKHRVSVCCDGISGPQPNGTKELAAFVVTHSNCSLNVIDEHCESFDEYLEWAAGNWRDLYLKSS